MDLEEALQRLYEVIPVIQTTEIVLLTEARGRVLSTDVLAPGNLPPFAASAMDGYALARTDFNQNTSRTFRVIGESRAGHPFAGAVSPGVCVRIFTGAKVPPGADQIILQEETASASETSVQFKPHVPGESYVRPVGHDVSLGRVLAQRGEILDALTLGGLAASGVAQVEVYQQPVVGVFSTGDELVDPGTPLTALRDGQIYDSNRFTVLELLRHSPCELVDLGRLADEADAVRTAFETAATQCQILITSGGVSVGDADFVTDTIAQLGALDFWRLNLKPGKPLAFGKIDNCFIFGLPGNPVSTIVTLLMLAKPAIYHFAGYTPPAPLKVMAELITPLSHSPGRTEFQRGALNLAHGKLCVSSTGDQSSNRLRSFQGANCLIEVPKQSADLSPGSEVWVLPFRGLLA